MKLKKFIAIIFATTLSLFLFTACGNKENNQQSSSAEENSKVVSNEKQPLVTVTTSFLRDMVSILTDNKVNIQVIIPAGEDPHTYTLKPQDHEVLSKADLVLYHGLHFEGKMVEILENLGHAVTKNFPKDKIGTFDEDGETVTDPHFWFDIDLYKLACEEAGKNLIDKFPELKETVNKNLKEYLVKLDKLDEENKEKLAQIPENQRYLITPHDAFNYFSRKYNITIKAPQGTSTEGEVSNKDVEETAQFIVDHKIKAIFSESTTNPQAMQKLKDVVKSKGFDVKVIQGEDQELFSDSLAPKGQKGDNYIDMFKHNIDLIVNNLK